MKIKSAILIILISLLTCLLAGCNGATTSVSASSGMTSITRLALGILKLEGSNNAISATQAQEMLTLWQGYQSISNSDTSSQLELDALVKQIESGMTNAQEQAIRAMGLTEQSVSETLSTLGGSINSGAPISTPGAVVGSNPTVQGGPAGGQGGMGPGGDSSGINDILNGVSTQTNSSATPSPASTGTEQINPMLLQAVIQLLESRSQATG